MWKIEGDIFNLETNVTSFNVIIFKVKSLIAEILKQNLLM